MGEIDLLFCCRIADYNEKQSRLHEYIEEESVLQEKIGILSEALRKAKNLVVYTGAGISTAAQIPDYRGPNGVWTCLQKGQKVR